MRDIQTTAKELIAQLKLTGADCFKLGIELITISNNATEQEINAIWGLKSARADKQPEISERAVRETFEQVFSTKTNKRLK